MINNNFISLTMVFIFEDTLKSMQLNEGTPLAVSRRRRHSRHIVLPHCGFDCTTVTGSKPRQVNSKTTAARSKTALGLLNYDHLKMEQNLTNDHWNYAC